MREPAMSSQGSGGPMTPEGPELVERLFLGAMVVYAAIAIVTFGHSAAHYMPEPKQEQDTRVADAVVAGLVWPLYWSWEIQS